MRKSSVEIASFSGNEVDKYEFRRSSGRLPFQNLQINSYQLISASSEGSADKIVEILEAIKHEMSAALTSLFGLWFASRWESDTSVNRAIGRKRFLSERGLHAVRFSNSGVVECNEEILHWGDLEIDEENFASFSAEISSRENGALFLCDRLRWPEFRADFMAKFVKGGNNPIPPLSHFEIVKLALSQDVPVITVTNWIEDDVIDFDLFRKS